jgi:2-haloacid dehalogenase
MSTCNLSGIKACVFDAYGTLFDVHSAVSGLSSDIGPTYAELSMLWRTKQLEYTWLRSLMKSHVDFWQITSDALHYAMDAMQIEDAALHEKLMQAYLSLDAFPEVHNVLALLKQAGIPAAILTNGSPHMISAAVNSAGLNDLITHQLSVENVGIYKPSASVYQIACDTLGVTADQICFQSSNAWDVAGAAHFGFHVAWVNRYGQPAERLPGQPDAVISDLEGLLGLIGLC